MTTNLTNGGAGKVIKMTPPINSTGLLPDSYTQLYAENKITIQLRCARCIHTYQIQAALPAPIQPIRIPCPSCRTVIQIDTVKPVSIVQQPIDTQGHSYTYVCYQPHLRKLFPNERYNYQPDYTQSY